jgi:hypothetical protein
MEQASYLEISIQIFYVSYQKDRNEEGSCSLLHLYQYVNIIQMCFFTINKICYRVSVRHFHGNMYLCTGICGGQVVLASMADARLSRHSADIL